MDTVKLLKQFAREHGINHFEVDKFLEKFSNPKTLEDVINLPHDMQTHHNFISYVGEPLKSYIMNRIYDGNRYETLKVDSLVDYLYDSAYDLLDADNMDIDGVGFENLQTSIEESKEELENLKAIAQHIVKTRFGSVVLDW